MCKMARIQDFTAEGALLGEGPGDRLDPQRVQGSARGVKPPVSSWELGNIGPLELVLSLLSEEI
jgi:hypothetical protein